jgi:myo-inositol catabolism protein IolS
MLYRELGTTGWKVSAIGLGTWNIGNQWGEVDESLAFSTIRKAFDHGINLFDTADSYGIPNGLSEERLGIALGGIRHQAYIVTKIGHWGERTGQEVPKTTVDMIRLCVHASLHRLRTDWIDVLLCHEPNVADPSIYLEAFELLKKQGKIRAYGVSTDILDSLKRFNQHNTCKVVEAGYSLVNRGAEKEYFPYCQQNGIGVLLKVPLAQGLLSGRYSAQSVFTDSIRSKWHRNEKHKELFLERAALVEKIKTKLKPEEVLSDVALKFAISHPVNPVALPGAKSPEQAIMNAKAGNQLFSDEQRKRLVLD